MGFTKKGKPTRLRGRAQFNVPDMPNEQPARNGKGRLSAGWYDLVAYEMNDLARKYFPRRLGGDWRTGRAPAMRPWKRQPASNASTDQATTASEQAEDGLIPPRRCSAALGGMTMQQGGYGPGSYAYEYKQAVAAKTAMLAPDESEEEPLPPWLETRFLPRPRPVRGLDAGLDGNPNRGATREKRFGLDDDWVQRVGMEKWERVGVTDRCPARLAIQYFLICPGPPEVSTAQAERPKRSTVDAKGLKGMTGTTSNCGDGSRGAHGKGWVCGQRVYKLFWVLAREGEIRDAVFAEDWINGLSSSQLARQSAAVSALIDRYGPIMGDDRLLRCRRCLRLRYGQSPEVLRKKRKQRIKPQGRDGLGPIQ